MEGVNRNLVFAIITLGSLLVMLVAGILFIVLDDEAPLVVASCAAIVFGSVRFLEEHFDTTKLPKYSFELTETEEALEKTENAELRRELRAKRSQLAPATRFEAEMRSTMLSSNALLVAAVALVGAIVTFGLYQWANGSAAPTTTGDAIERLAVVGAAFYLAGQLFRRSNQLNTQARQFQRAAIAMSVTDGLADLIDGEENSKVRAEFRRSVYEFHLKGSNAAEAASSDDTDSALKLIESINKLRGGSS